MLLRIKDRTGAELRIRETPECKDMLIELDALD